MEWVLIPDKLILLPFYRAFSINNIIFFAMSSTLFGFTFSEVNLLDFSYITISITPHSFQSVRKALCAYLHLFETQEKKYLQLTIKEGGIIAIFISRNKRYD